MVALTGDLVDGFVAELGPETEPLRDLSAPFGLFFVTGNHEYYFNAPAWVRHVESLGMTVLNNSHRLIEKDGGRILMAGVTDLMAGRFVSSHASDPFKAMENAPDSDVKILLAHQPKSVYQAEKAGFDIQLSGHTHGGQMFPWNLLIALNQPFLAGLYTHGNTRLYVSRGTGYWGPPMRIGAPSEITRLILVPEQAPE
jgi:predicted MPP superfamily phosphohydrolase